MSEIVQGILVVKERANGKGKEYKANYTYLGKSKEMPVYGSVIAFNESDAVDGVAIEIEINPANQGPRRVTIVGKQAVAPAVKNTQQKGFHQGYKGSANDYSRGAGNRNASFSPQPAKETGENGLDGATAPYNFVPFDRKLVVQDLPLEQGGDMFSGVLYCSLEAKTPLLVAGAQNRDENIKPVQRHFMEVDGNKVIPGTSLKGMLRSLVETHAGVWPHYHPPPPPPR